MAEVGCEESVGGSGEGVFTIYDARFGPAKGWSHIVTHPENFPLIKRDKERYAVDSSCLTTDPDCGSLPVFRSILTRKLSNWGQQHANGIEPVFFGAPLKVETVESVAIWLKFNAAESFIPSREALAKPYGDHLTPEQIDRLDQGKACLGFTFAAAGYNDQETETLNAVALVEFDPARDFDKWLRVELPLSAFQFGFERQYAMRPVGQEEASGHEFVAFRINPEASGGIVSRNFLNDGWDDSVPELYKEMSVSLRRIEVRLKRKE